MGSLPALMLLMASFLALISLALLLIITFTGKYGVKGAALGLRTALRRPVEGLVRAVPTALVVSVVLASLSVGDSLHLMVEVNTEANLSDVDVSIVGNGPVPPRVMERLSAIPGSGVLSWAPVVQRQGVGRSGGAPGSFDVNILALDPRALSLAPLEEKDGPKISELPGWGECYVSEELSRTSGASVGDWVLVELRDDELSARSLLGMTPEGRTRMNLTVTKVIEGTGWGRYREDARSEPPPVLVTDLSTVSLRLGWGGMSDSFLIDLGPSGSASKVRKLLDDAVDLESSGFGTGRAESAGGSMLWKDDVFFRSPAGLDRIAGGHVPTLSYFVDSIEGGGSSVPYSVVTGMDEELGPDGIMVGEWLRSRLNLTVGDTLVLRYRRLTDIGTLAEGNRSFVVRGSLPQAGLAAEPSLMPPIPGITEAASCSDWDPSFDIDLELLDDEDRAYWEELRTSPKAFISLSTAREMWQVHYGDTTAVWFPSPGPDLGTELEGLIGAAEAGLSVVDLEERAMSSSRGLAIFSPMFLTFGVPFMAASVFVLFSLERDLFLRRLEELSVLRAVGGPRRMIAAAFAWSGAISILAGALLGIGAGTLLSMFFSAGLSSIWSTTVENARVPLSISAQTLLTAVLAGSSVSILASTLLSLLHSGRVPMKNLRGEDASMTGRGKRPLRVAASASLIVCGLAALAVLFLVPERLPVEAVFIGSSAALSAGIASLMVLAVPVVRWSGPALLLSAEISRRPARYPLAGAVIALTLSLVLSMTAVSGMLLDSESTLMKDYGGGYEVFMELSVPYTGDLQEALDGSFPDLRAVPLFTVGSEGGRCTNVNAVYPPRLIGAGTPAEDWEGFKLLERDGRYASDKDAWAGLPATVEGMVPILVDQNTLVWIYGKGLGDVFTLESENGTVVRSLVVGVLSPSVLTGTFVMSRSHLLRMFPSAAAVRAVLVDIPSGEVEEVGTALERTFSESSPKVRSTADLAREDLEGELSYLDLFRDLLFLGLFTAVASSFAFVHSRVVALSRELSVLRAVGFGRRRAFLHLGAMNLSVVSVAVLSALFCAAVTSPVLSRALSSGTGAGMVSGTLLTAFAFLVFSAVISYLSAGSALRGFTTLVGRD